MSEQETEQERRKRREDEAVIAAKNMLDQLSKDELSSAQETISSGVKEIIEKQEKDPGDILGIKAVVSEEKALEALNRQEHDKLVNEEYMKKIDKDYDEALEEMGEIDK